MIKAIVFDLDGVIIESAEIKTRAFEELFADYPDRLPEIIQYHQENAGISRYVKFRYFYDRILGQELKPRQEAELGERFSQIALKQILEAPLVPGAIEFLTENRSRYSMFVASGTPEAELHDILDRRQLKRFFLEIHGAPKSKADIVEDIGQRYSFSRKEIVFVGDAESDRAAAGKTGTFFIARMTGENRELLKDCRWQIDDLTGLQPIIQHIDRQGGC